MHRLLFCCVGNAFVSPLMASLYNAEAEARGIPSIAISAGLTSRRELPPTAPFAIAAVEAELTELPKVIEAMRAHQPRPLSDVPFVVVDGVSYVHDPERKKKHLTQDFRAINAWLLAGPSAPVMRFAIADGGYAAWETMGRPSIDSDAGQAVVATYRRDVVAVRALVSTLLAASAVQASAAPAEKGAFAAAAAPTVRGEDMRAEAAQNDAEKAEAARIEAARIEAKRAEAARLEAARGARPPKAERAPKAPPGEWRSPKPSWNAPVAVSRRTPAGGVYVSHIDSSFGPAPAPVRPVAAVPPPEPTPLPKRRIVVQPTPVEIIRPKIEPEATTAKKGRKTKSEPLDPKEAERAEVLGDVKAWLRAALPTGRAVLSRYTLWDRAEAQFGSWDAAVKAAGIPVADEPLWELPARDLDLSFDILVEALPNPVVARLCDVTIQKVARRRRDNGAPDPARQLHRRIVATGKLGEVADEAIAAQLGVTPEEVAEVRAAERETS